jgi:hypothetical protein
MPQEPRFLLTLKWTEGKATQRSAPLKGQPRLPAPTAGLVISTKCCVTFQEDINDCPEASMLTFLLGGHWLCPPVSLAQVPACHHHACVTFSTRTLSLIEDELGLRVVK